MNEIVSGILSVLLVAILISTIFFYVFNTKGPWGSFWTFFLVILFCVWIANLWIRPHGPLIYGIGWITLATTGLLVALLLAAMSGHSRNKNVKVEKKQENPDPESEGQYQSISRNTATLSGIFWIFMVILPIIIILGYIL